MEEGSELIEEEPAPEVLDAGLIAAAQRVEHYEMAAYGTLRSFANLLGHKNAVKHLETTLKEEEVNPRAMSPEEGQALTKTGSGRQGRKAKA